jgi:hypothetical protein
VPEPGGHDEVDVDAAVGDYDGWLTRQPLAARARDAYLAQARDFVTRLAGSEHARVRGCIVGRFDAVTQTTTAARTAAAGGSPTVG